MLAPALAIALSARLFPEAGLLLGAVAYTVGIVILLSDKRSEPDVDYMHSIVSDNSDSNASEGSAFRLFPHVAVLFGGIFLLGLLYGFLDPATYAFARETVVEEVASLVFMASAVVSIAAGLVFGMVYINASALRQVLFAGLAVGVLYLPMALVTNVPLLFAAHIVGAFSYAPFVITLNATVERTVPSSRVTECLTWLNAGMQLGMAIGPVAGGIIIDTFGTGAAFGACALTGMGIPLLFAACAPVLRKRLR
jgi:MFS family permease